MIAMLKSWEDQRAEVYAEAWAEARAESILIILRARGIVLPDDARERILAQKDHEQLQRWLEKACVASSIDEVTDDPR